MALLRDNSLSAAYLATAPLCESATTQEKKHRHETLCSADAGHRLLISKTVLGLYAVLAKLS